MPYLLEIYQFYLDLDDPVMGSLSAARLHDVIIMYHKFVDYYLLPVYKINFEFRKNL